MKSASCIKTVNKRPCDNDPFYQIMQKKSFHDARPPPSSVSWLSTSTRNEIHFLHCRVDSSVSRRDSPTAAVLIFILQLYEPPQHQRGVFLAAEKRHLFENSNRRRARAFVFVHLFMARSNKDERKVLKRRLCAQCWCFMLRGVK